MFKFDFSFFCVCISSVIDFLLLAKGKRGHKSERGLLRSWKYRTESTWSTDQLLFVSLKQDEVLVSRNCCITFDTQRRRKRLEKRRGRKRERNSYRLLAKSKILGFRQCEIHLDAPRWTPSLSHWGSHKKHKIKKDVKNIYVKKRDARRQKWWPKTSGKRRR